MASDTQGVDLEGCGVIFNGKPYGIGVCLVLVPGVDKPSAMVAAEDAWLRQARGQDHVFEEAIM